MKYLVALLIGILLAEAGLIGWLDEERRSLKTEIAILKTKVQMLQEDLDATKYHRDKIEEDIMSALSRRDKIENRLVLARAELKKMTSYRDLHASDADLFQDKYHACQRRLLAK